MQQKKRRMRLFFFTTDLASGNALKCLTLSIIMKTHRLFLLIIDIFNIKNPVF